MEQKFDTFDFRGEAFFARKLPKKRNTVQTAHFRWKVSGKGSRLYFCLGGQTVAAWPAKDDGAILATVKTKMASGHFPLLSRDQRKIKRLALLLHKALLKAETGPRQRTIFKQRMRLEKWLATIR